MKRQRSEVGGQRSEVPPATSPLPSPTEPGKIPPSPFPSPPAEGAAPERLLTRKGLAAFLQVGVRTVDTMLALGEIEAIRIRGRLVRFRIEDVLRKLKGE